MVGLESIILCLFSIFPIYSLFLFILISCLLLVNFYSSMFLFLNCQLYLFLKRILYSSTITICTFNFIVYLQVILYQFTRVQESCALSFSPSHPFSFLSNILLLYIQKVVCSYSLYLSCSELFMPLCRPQHPSGIIFLQPSFSFSCSGTQVAMNSLILCLPSKSLYFIFIFEGYFHWVQNYRLTVFFFQPIKDVVPLSSGLHCF